MTHGSMSFSVEDNILVINGRGPWNLNAIEQGVVDTNEQIKTLYHKPWGVLMIALGDSILVPEAAIRLTKIIESDRRKGRLATALVIRECGIPKFVEQHLGQIYLSAGDEFKYFDEITDAKQWLQQLLKCNYPLVPTQINIKGTNN